MKNKLFTAFIFMLSFNVFAGSLSKDIETLIDKRMKTAQVGIIVQSLDSGDILYHRLADNQFYPASNTKLFLSAAALKVLGENYRFKTVLLLSKDQLKENKLEGPLYLKFSGDPSFKLKHLDKMFKTLVENNIQSLDGNIIIDDTAFSDPYYSQGWTWDSLPWYYSAPVSTIIINQNKTAIYVEESKAVSKPVKFQHKAKFPTIELQSAVKGVSRKTAEFDCQLDISQMSHQYEINGCWPVDKTPLTLEIAYSDPRKLAIDAIKNVLAKNQIEFKGKILFGKADPKAKAIAVHHSEKLAHLLKYVLANSNNLYTEAITKTLGLARYNEGTFKQGVNAIKTTLNEHFNLPSEHYRLMDGSGASRYTLISPSFISELLYQMKQDNSFKTYYNALSFSGKDGKLENRMANKKLKGKVVAKTGSAMGTTALSGYITVNSGKQYIFTLVVNQSLEKYENLKAFEDAFCALLFDAPQLQ